MAAWIKMITDEDADQELMDIFKWNTLEECDLKMSEKSSREEAIDELADILIYAIAFANRNRINISEAITQKMLKNM